MEQLVNLMGSIAVSAASSLVSAAIAGSALLLAAVVALRLLPEMRPANRFAVWGFVLLACVGFYFLPIGHQPSTSDLQPVVRTLHLDPRWAWLAVSLWATIAFVRCFRVVQSAIELHGISSRAVPVPSDGNSALLGRGFRSATLCTSDEVDRPCVVGFFTPRVLIPHDVYGALSDSELEQIVLHEMEHVRRLDDWTNLLQKISLALFPLNPAIAWLERRLCAERELACDDCVLQSTSSRKQYATCLTMLAEFLVLRRDLSLALGAWSRRSELAKRVHRILHQPRYRMGRGVGCGLTVALAGGLLGGGAMLARIPALVSFSAPVASVTASLPAVGSPVAHTAGLQRGTQAAPVLVKAVMPQLSHKPASIEHRKRHGYQVQRVRSRNSLAPQPLVIRTTLNDESTMPRWMLTVDRTTGSSYAAVPVGNGWLFIQL